MPFQHKERISGNRREYDFMLFISADCTNTHERHRDNIRNYSNRNVVLMSFPVFAIYGDNGTNGMLTLSGGIFVAD